MRCSWCAASRKPCAPGAEPDLIPVQGKPGLSHSCFSIGINVFVPAWEADTNICLHMCVRGENSSWNNEVEGEGSRGLRGVILHDTFSLSLTPHLLVRPLRAGKILPLLHKLRINRLQGQKEGKASGGGKKTREM